MTLTFAGVSVVLTHLLSGHLEKLRQFHRVSSRMYHQNFYFVVVETSTCVHLQSVG